MLIFVRNLKMLENKGDFDKKVSNFVKKVSNSDTTMLYYIS